MTRNSAVPASTTGHTSSVSKVGFALVLFGAALWGTNGITGSLVANNSEMSWAAVVALRLFFGGIAITVVTVFTGELRKLPNTRGTWVNVGLTAAFSVVFAGAYFSALDYVGVAVATVVSIGTATVFLTVSACVRERRRPAASLQAALVGSLIGLVLVCMSDSRALSGDGVFGYALGIGLSVLSGVAFGLQTVVNSKPTPGLSAKVLVGLSFSIAGVVCMPWALAEGFRFDTMTPTSWSALVVLTFVSTLVGFLAYYAGLHRGVPPATAGISIAIEPAVAALLAVLVLNEHLTLPAIGGMVLVVISVLLVRPRNPVRRRWFASAPPVSG